MVFQCTGCEALTFQPLAIRKKNPNPNSIKFGLPTGPFVSTNCEHCGFKHHVSLNVFKHKLKYFKVN
jgi:tRNA (guanine26-N2/guanine27-N2)-dimethyltransferase